MRNEEEWAEIRNYEENWIGMADPFERSVHGASNEEVKITEKILRNHESGKLKGELTLNLALDNLVNEETYSPSILPCRNNVELALLLQGASRLIGTVVADTYGVFFYDEESLKEGMESEDENSRIFAKDCDNLAKIKKNLQEIIKHFTDQ